MAKSSFKRGETKFFFLSKTQLLVATCLDLFQMGPVKALYVQQSNWFTGCCYTQHLAGQALKNIYNVWVSEVAQSCPTLCHPIDCSIPGCSVHEISQATVLECIAISFFTGSSPPRDWTHMSCIDRWVLYHWATREA